MSRYFNHESNRKGPKVLFIIAVVALVALVISVVYIRHQYYESLKPVSASQTSQLVTVELGSTASEIAVTLKKQGLIRQTWSFEWYIRNNNLRDKLQAGTYYIQPSQSVPEITDILTNGQIATDLVTILPGKRVDQLRQALVNSGFKPDDVERAFDPALYTNHPALVDKPVGASLEGYLYPESFQKDSQTKPEVILTAALDEMQKYLTPDIRAGFVKQGLTVHQGVILASIVEKEVGKQDDRPTVAQVFLSRLEQNMALESDATTSYGAILEGRTPTVAYDSAYNTYKHKGLPPGPVSNVSVSSLKAVAFPDDTDFIFFVAGNDCKTRFSKTLKEHEAFIAKHGVGCK